MWQQLRHVVRISTPQHASAPKRRRLGHNICCVIQEQHPGATLPEGVKCPETIHAIGLQVINIRPGVARSSEVLRRAWFARGQPTPFGSIWERATPGRMFMT